jgi:hypothetical protein
MNRELLVSSYGAYQPEAAQRGPTPPSHLAPLPGGPNDDDLLKASSEMEALLHST